MGTRMKLASLALGALTIALAFLVPMMMPTPAPPASVDQIRLQAPPGGEQRTVARADAVGPDRTRRGSRHSDRRARATAWKRRQSNSPANARSNASPEGAGRRDAAVPGGLPAADSPTARSRSDSAPRSNGSPGSRITPVGGVQPAPSEAAPQGAPTEVSAEATEQPDPPEAADPPADAPDPADPAADPPDEDPATAAADPPDQPEPASATP